MSDRDSARPVKPDHSVPSPPGHTVPGDDVVLLDLDGEGTFLVFGQLLPGHETLPLPLLSTEDQRDLGHAVAGSLGALDVTAQAARGIGQARGLVRLAPETMRALRDGSRPLVHNGWNLGSLTLNGKISQTVRWLPAGSAGAAGVLAAVGPAAALVAVQWQLAQISRQVQKNIALTNEVLTMVRTEQWAEVRGHHDTVMAELSHAQVVGAVTPDIWRHVQAQAAEAALRKDRQLFAERVRGHTRGLLSQSGAQARQEWLAQNGEVVLREVDALLMAERAWFVYQALRAGHLSETAATDRRDAALQAKVVEDARTAHALVLAAAGPLLDALYRHCRLMESCPGGTGLKVRGRRRAPAEVAQAAKALADQVATMATGLAVAVDGADAAPSLGWIDVAERSREVSERLRWVLDRDERLVAVAYGSASFWTRSKGYVAFTDRRVLACKASAFLRSGAVDREIAWDDVTDILTAEKGGLGGPDIVLWSGDKDRHIQLARNVAYPDVVELVRQLRSIVRMPQDDTLALPPARPSRLPRKLRWRSPS